jgi:hypothetical protein
MDWEKASDTAAGKGDEQPKKAEPPAPPARKKRTLRPGEYLAHIVDGRMLRYSTGKVGYRLTFRVAAGEFAGWNFYHTLWMTEAALPLTLRDLAWLGLTDIEQLRKPLPKSMRCRVRVNLVSRGGGPEHVRVVSVEVLKIDPPAAGDKAPGEGQSA